MIISHKYKYIFIRPFKTAGSSIEKYLIDYAFDSETDVKSLKKGEGPHITAQKIKNNMNPDDWDSYLKISTERNPWDKIISWFFWDRYVTDYKKNKQYYRSNIFLKEKNGVGNFHHWFNDKIKKLNVDENTIKNPLSYKYYFIDGISIVDHFILKENIINDLTLVLSKIGLDFKKDKFINYKEKTGVRPKWSKDYKLFYSDDMVKFVYELNEKIIELLNYEYK